MEKLLFAIAGAASFAALAADPTPGANDISIVGFENYTADAGVVGTGDDGQPGNTLWTCAGEDASLVKTYGGDNAAAPTIKEPAPFDGASENAKYLALDTNGSELRRKINADGSAQTIADPLYIDTLVQFTPSESAPTSTDLDGAKLAIWLGVDSENNTTNLYVQGLQYSDSEISVSAPVAYKITNVIPQPGTWYRLTVKAIRAALSKAGMVSAFTVAIDGTEAIAEQCLLVGDAFATAEGDVVLGDSGYILTADDFALISAKKVFGSMADLGETGLTSVGFKGTGAIDDFVVTTAQPDFTPAAIDFILTWPTTLTSVSYTLDGEAGEALTIANGTVTIHGTNGAPVTLTGSLGYATKTVTGAVAANGTLALTAGIDLYFPLTATAGQDGSAEHPFEVADATGIKSLAAAVAALADARGLSFVQTANIDMASAGPFAGIGTYAANLNNGVAFQGTYDGQGFKISNIDFTQRNYGGIFNQVKGGTIKNLTVDTITCSTYDSEVNSGEWGCAIIGNAGLGATLQGLTAMGSFGSAATPCTHNVAGIAIRVCGGASNVVNGVTMLETLVKDCTNNATLYGAYTKCAGITALTQDQNGVPNDYVLFDGCVNNANIAMVAGKGTEGRDGLAGILAYVSDGTKIQNCSNSGTFTSPLSSAKIGAIVGWAQGRFLDDLGGNSAPATQKMIYDQNGSTITGFKYATVDNGVATTVTALAKDTTYLLEGNVAASETPVFTLAEEGDTIAFDAALDYTFAGTIAAAEGLEASSATAGTVTTYTAAVAASGAEFVDGADDLLDADTTVTADDIATYVAGVTGGAAPAQITKPMVVSYMLSANKILTTPETEVLKITAIEQVTGGWKITVAAALNAADVAAGATVNLNNIAGNLKVTATADLGTAFAPVAANAFTVAAGENGAATITVTDANAKFLKATVTK